MIREAVFLNIMKFFGFENDDDDYDDDYTEDRRSRKPSPRKEGTSRSAQQGNPNAGGKLILFKGVASDNDKRRLREAFNNGAMILIDLHELSQREFEEAGKDFITFMGGVAFARNGEISRIEPLQFLITPRKDMYEDWSEEAPHE